MDTVDVDEGKFKGFGKWAAGTKGIVSVCEDMTNLGDVLALKEISIPELYPMVGNAQVCLDKTCRAARLEEITIVAVANSEGVNHATAAVLANRGRGFSG